jgi:Ribonuclease G/E
MFDLEPIKERLADLQQPDDHPIRALFEVADLAALVAEVERLRGQVNAVKAAVANHPDPCEKHPDGDAVSCGWKTAYKDVVRALEAA